MSDPAKDFILAIEFIASTSDPDLCPHPSEDELVTMLRAERDTDTTPKRLDRARRCEGCLLMLGLIKHYNEVEGNQ